MTTTTSATTTSRMSPMTTTEGTRRRPVRTTVRTRVLAAVLVLAALGMAVSGATAYLLQRERVDELIDTNLARNLDEFRALALDGIDPSTGEPFTTTSGLLYTALERNVPARNEGMLAIVDERVTWVAARTVQVRPEDDAELVAAATNTQGTQTTLLRTLRTDLTTYRYLAVPVKVRGDASEGVLLLAFDRPAEHAELVRTYRTYALVALTSLVVLGVVAWVVAGRLLRPIRLLRETSQRITDSDLSERIPVTGNDDLSELARTSNAMLDRLERAFTAQRRLLDDAGHELRTPLTIVRGHLELLDPADPAEVAATRALVIDEVDRMHGLVDDLVVLATVDRPDFVRPQPSDVGRLTDEVLEKARTLGPQRWVVTARADVEAELDERRLTQAWLQLAANAAKFAPADTPVRLASTLVGTASGPAIQLTVEDEGPGVPPVDAERVFERFARSRVGRGVEGSGLGLPIVAAIAAAHGGTAWVDSPTDRPGSDGPGSLFVIQIPVTSVVDPEEPS